eukprot:s618_g1.t1
MDFLWIFHGFRWNSPLLAFEVSCLGRALHFLALLVQLQALLSPSAFTVEAYCRAFHLAWSRRTDDGETAPVQLALDYRVETAGGFFKRLSISHAQLLRQGPYTDQLQVALEQHLQLREAYVRGGWLRLHRAFQKLTGAEFTKALGGGGEGLQPW